MPTPTAPAVAVSSALATCLAALPVAVATPPGLTVQRVWRPPPLTRESLTGQPPAAIILPVEDAETRAARQAWTREITLELALVSAITEPTTAVIDPLLLLAETCLTACRTLVDLNGQQWQQLTRETLALADVESLNRGAWFHVTQLVFGAG